MGSLFFLSRCLDRQEVSNYTSPFPYFRPLPCNQTSLPNSLTQGTVRYILNQNQFLATVICVSPWATACKILKFYRGMEAIRPFSSCQGLMWKLITQWRLVGQLKPIIDAQTNNWWKVVPHLFMGPTYWPSWWVHQHVSRWTVQESGYIICALQLFYLRFFFLCVKIEKAKRY